MQKVSSRQPLPDRGSAQAADRFAPIRATIRRFLDSTGTASVAVAVAKDGKILWEEGFGLANRERMIPATQHTMYSMASISKPITATGLMVLVERGRVALDHPINEYLGAGKVTGLAGDASSATVQRVMSHTAGLPLHYQFFYADPGYDPPSMDETISRYGNLVFAPGSHYQYSNLGFGIIDHVIARTSGLAYRDFMRSEVFLPLGLTHTSIDIGPGLADFAAERYDEGQKPIPFYAFDHAGASAVYSSAHDLIRFAMFHLKDRLPEQRAILTPATIDLMHQAVAPANYGLGWAIAKDFGFTRLSHNGGMPGVATAMNLYPNENLAVVVLANTSTRPDFIALDIAGLFLPHYADSLVVRRARPPTRPAAYAATADLIGEWTGTLKSWNRTDSLRMVVRPDGDILVWVGHDPRVIVNDPGFADGTLTGRFPGHLPTSDAGRWPHDLFIGLILNGGKLRGQVNAMSLTTPIMYSLASYADLTKK